MGIAEKLPPYIPPPWRQKNPLMEKACQVYHKQTAPAEAIEEMKKIKIVTKKEGKELKEKSVVETVRTDKHIVTTVFFRDERGMPAAVCRINTKGRNTMIVAKMTWAGMNVYHEGEKVADLGRGTNQGFETVYL